MLLHIFRMTDMKRSDGLDLTWCERRRRFSLARAGRAICRPRPNCAPALIGCFLDQSALPLAARTDRARGAHAEYFCAISFNRRSCAGIVVRGSAAASYSSPM